MEDYKQPHVPKPPWTLTHHCWRFPKPCHCCSNVLYPPLETELAQQNFGLHCSGAVEILVRQWNFPAEYSIEIMISLHYRNKEIEIINVSLENRMDGRTDGLRRY